MKKGGSYYRIMDILQVIAEQASSQHAKELGEELTKLSTQSD
mgnify:CR=1 FL=1